MRVKTAHNWHRLPSDYLLVGEDLPVDVVKAFDLKVTMAHDILMAETCQSCGVPIWLGHAEDNTIEFDLDDTICYSCAALETKRAENRDKYAKDASAMYGVTEFVRPTGMRPDGDYLKSSFDYLPSRAESLKAMSIKAELEAKRKEEAIMQARGQQ